MKQMREAFEAWAESRCYFLDRDAEDKYIKCTTALAWEIWREAQPKVNRNKDKLDNPLADEAIRVLQAAGYETLGCGIADEFFSLKDKIFELEAALSAVPAQDPVKGCKECEGQTYMHSPTGEYLGECPYCTAEQDPYAYDVPTKDGTELAYAIYYTKYNNPLPEGAIPLYLEPVKQESWISVEKRFPESKDEVLIFEKSGNISFAFFDGKAWFINEYERNYGYIQQKLPNELVTHWMPLPLPPVKEVTG